MAFCQAPEDWQIISKSLKIGLDRLLDKLLQIPGFVNIPKFVNNSEFS